MVRYQKYSPEEEKIFFVAYIIRANRRQREAIRHGKSRRSSVQSKQVSEHINNENGIKSIRKNSSNSVSISTGLHHHLSQKNVPTSAEINKEIENGKGETSSNCDRIEELHTISQAPDIQTVPSKQQQVYDEERQEGVSSVAAAETSIQFSPWQWISSWFASYSFSSKSIQHNRRDSPHQSYSRRRRLSSDTSPSTQMIAAPGAMPTSTGSNSHRGSGSLSSGFYRVHPQSTHTTTTAAATATDTLSALPPSISHQVDNGYGDDEDKKALSATMVHKPVSYNPKYCRGGSDGVHSHDDDDDTDLVRPFHDPTTATL